MRKRTILILAVAITGVFLTNTGFAEILPYEIIDLGTLGGNMSHAYSINDAGQVVGQSRTASGGYHAFLWDSTSGMTDLGSGWAMGINDAGQVVGGQVVGYSDYHAFLWEDGEMLDLGTLGGSESEAHAINEAGQVVGAAETISGQTHAFLWDSTSGMTDLGVLSGSYSRAYSINNAGQVVGDSGGTFLWDSTSGITELDPGISHAYAINDFGQVVGWAPRGEENAVIWSEGVVTYILESEDSDWSWAYDINNAGQVVGLSQGPLDAFDGAFLWDSTNGAVLLEDLLTADFGWEYLTSAKAINNYGQIVGYGRINDENHAFLMTPVPEPATLLLLALGSLVLRQARGQVLRRRK